MIFDILRKAIIVITNIVMLVYFVVAPSQCAYASTYNEILDSCRMIGISNRVFPHNIKNEELFIEEFTVIYQGHIQKKYLVTSSVQREDVEFGWLSYQCPTNKAISIARDYESYTVEKSKFELEEILGPYHFWSAEEKGQFYSIKAGIDRFVVCDNLLYSQEHAIDIACYQLSTVLGYPIDKKTPFLIDSTFYNEQEKQYWGVVFRKNEVSDSVAFDAVYGIVIDASSGCVIEIIDYTTQDKCDYD